MNPTIQAVVAAAASFFIVSFLFTLLYLLCRKLQTRNHPQTRIRSQPQPQSQSTPHTHSESFDPSLDRISMSELLRATKNFSPDGIIGDGGFGLVYKARLSSGATVAVKKLSKDAFQGFREFQAEMETLGKNQIRHPNLVRILGYCVSGDDRVLIYEFIEKGSLDQWLYNTSSSYSHRDTNAVSRCESGARSKSESISGSRPGSNLQLKWEIRVKIMKGVAEGLLFLHTLDTPIIHRDIKASNVLLDSEFEAHIADFGLARRIELWHSHVSTQVAGTMGYMPPEYIGGVMAASVKGDIYSFGVLMIEVAAGRRPNWPMRMEDGKEIGLVKWAENMVEQGWIIEMVDLSVSREELRESEVGEYMRIARLCTSDQPKDRPVMGEVVTLLNQLSLRAEEYLHR